jgi:hypothetical protein
MRIACRMDTSVERAQCMSHHVTSRHRASCDAPCKRIEPLSRVEGKVVRRTDPGKLRRLQNPPHFSAFAERLFHLSMFAERLFHFSAFAERLFHLSMFAERLFHLSMFAERWLHLSMFAERLPHENMFAEIAPFCAYCRDGPCWDSGGPR